MSIYLSRHGQTQWNLSGRLQGHLNSPLTSQGVEQAKQLAVLAEKHDITHVISSDLGRALDTAWIVAKQLSCSVSINCDLRERNLGVIQGIDRCEAPKLWRAFERRFFKDELDISDAEPASVVANRILYALQKIQDKHSERNVLVVGHGEWLRILMNIQAGFEPWSDQHCVPNNGELLPLKSDFLLECA